VAVELPPVSRSTAGGCSFLDAAASMAMRLGAEVDGVTGEGVLVVAGAGGVMERLLWAGGRGTANSCADHMTIQYIVTT
jgi:hypothetical protein